MKYDLDDDTRAALVAISTGEDVKVEYFIAALIGCHDGLWRDAGKSAFALVGKGHKLRINRTIRIGEYNVPEPMRTAPQTGARYYVPNVFPPHNPYTFVWDCGESGEKRLDAGYCQASMEGAAIQGKALYCLTKIKQ